MIDSDHTHPPPAAAGFSIAALGVAQICSWGTLYYRFPQLA